MVSGSFRCSWSSAQTQQFKCSFSPGLEDRVGGEHGSLYFGAGHQSSMTLFSVLIWPLLSRLCSEQ